MHARPGQLSEDRRVGERVAVDLPGSDPGTVPGGGLGVRRSEPVVAGPTWSVPAKATPGRRPTAGAAAARGAALILSWAPCGLVSGSSGLAEQDLQHPGGDPGEDVAAGRCARVRRRASDSAPSSSARIPLTPARVTISAPASTAARPSAPLTAPMPPTGTRPPPMPPDQVVEERPVLAQRLGRASEAKLPTRASAATMPRTVSSVKRPSGSRRAGW